MLLVLDTCFNACSAALYDDVAGRVVASGYSVMERGHAEALGPMVQQVFADAGRKPQQLSRIAVTRGPGTFTGLRVGLSYAKGMALALNIPLLGIDSLTATAVPYFGNFGQFAIAHKAGGTGLFYWALFDGETSTHIIPPSLASMDEILKRAIRVLPENDPQAEQFAAYAAALPWQEATVEPLYLRPPDAKPSVSAEVSRAHVRVATAADIPTLAEIHAESFAKAWTVEDLTATLALPGAQALVVELMGTIYGFVQFQWVVGEAEINTICVLPNYRRQQFGRDLMEELIRHLQAIGTTKLFLEVAEINLAARGLYDRFGFVISGLRKGYYADGQNAVTMVRELGV
jgi:tRNA threonylcarbamoyl adenosine modification protein YeaZ/ribosomal-protein-alanine acetyltransferase